MQDKNVIPYTTEIIPVKQTDSIDYIRRAICSAKRAHEDHIGPHGPVCTHMGLGRAHKLCETILKIHCS